MFRHPLFASSMIPENDGNKPKKVSKVVDKFAYQRRFLAGLANAKWNDDWNTERIHSGMASQYFRLHNHT